TMAPLPFPTRRSCDRQRRLEAGRGRLFEDGPDLPRLRVGDLEGYVFVVARGRDEGEVAGVGAPLDVDQLAAALDPVADGRAVVRSEAHTYGTQSRDKH